MHGELLTLRGCAPTPLASYLKALGVLRLISSPANHVSGQAADADARGWWQDERFHLRTTLDRDGLIRFFSEDYAPSPIIAPWNGRAGFLEGDAAETSTRRGATLMREIEQSQSSRLRSMRKTIGTLRNNRHLDRLNSLRTEVKSLQIASKRLAGAEKRANAAQKSRVEREARVVKSLLLPSVRAESDLDHVSYVDVCYVLAADETPAPLLGSGGNDGSRDFGVNFAEELLNLFDFGTGEPTDRASLEIESSMFGVSRRAGGHGSMGQFSPGQGGPNSTTGYGGFNPLNSWDVVLGLEGTLAFGGALTRRWGATGDSRASFPFTFEPSNAGSGSLSLADPNRPRGEIWTPLWPKAATFAELVAIFAEGRLTLGGRTARTGLDAARSVARLGSARGISAFERYSIIQPDRKTPYQATPLGRFTTPARPRSDLIDDLEAGEWLSRVRSLVNQKTAPAFACQIMRQFDDALFLMTNASRKREGTRGALVALGQLVRWFATSSDARAGCPPPPRLSPNWVLEAYKHDRTPEYRIAAALAGIGLPTATQNGNVKAVSAVNSDGEVPENPSLLIHTPQAGSASVAPPMAAHFAPINERHFLYPQGRQRTWANGDSLSTTTTMVWGTGGLLANLITVLERRLVEASIRMLLDKPLASATFVGLADITAFLSGDFDDAQCAALLAGLVWAQPTPLSSSLSDRNDTNPSAPLAYAALKPVFTPDATLTRALHDEQIRIPIPPGLIVRLRTGADSRDGRATDAAVRTAFARAMASGLSSPFGSTGINAVGIAPDRLAAALLIPIGVHTLQSLVDRAYSGTASEVGPTKGDVTHVT